VKRIVHRLSRGGDEGSALLLALIVVLVTGILLAAALSFAGTGLQVTTKVRDQRNLTNYEQGAVDGAISAIRGSNTAGGFNPATGNAYPCPDYNPTTPTSDLGADTTTYNVTCTPKAVLLGTGDKSVPSFAVLTLGSDPVSGGCQANKPASCVGFNDISGSHTLRVLGGLFSHGTITVSGGSNQRILVEGSAYGQSARCDKTQGTTVLISTTDGKGPQCPSYVDSANIGADPKYAAAIGDDVTDPTNAQRGSSAATLAATTKDPVPMCSGGVATFSPGYYGELPEDLLANPHAQGCSAGFSGLENFSAGNYYFDFPASESTWSPDELIGGSIDPAFTGSNWANACDSTKPGVQFEFGGASSINLATAADVALCGPNPTATDAYQDISLYALSANNTNALPSPPGPQDKLFAASQPPSNVVGKQPFVNSSSGVDPLCPLCVADAQTTGDGNHGSVLLTSNQEADLSYPAFVPVPDGARISGLGVCVTDAPDSNAGTPTVKVRLPAQSVGGSPVSVDASLSATNTTTCPSPNNLYTLTTANLNQVLPDVPQWSEAQQLTVTYAVKEKNGKTGTSTVDGLSLDVTFTAPALEVSAPQNSTNNPDCNDTSASLDFFCAGTPMASSGALYVGGTVYTPTVDVTANAQNKGQVFFIRGVVANSLTVSDSASFRQRAEPFQVPGPSSTLKRLVLFTAKADGVPVLRACVEYIDNIVYADGTKGPALPGYRVKVRHWDVLRSPDSLSPSCA
jgi:hypothetical protein